MTEQEKEQQFRDKISRLESRISELSIESEKRWTELCAVKMALNSSEREKEKLLSIVENLSKGFAKLGE